MNQYTEICEKFFGRKIQTSKKEQEGKGKTLMKDRERLRNYLKSVQKLKKNAKYKAIINDEQILEITKFHENTSKKAELNEGEMKSLLKYSEMLNGIITEAKKIDKQKTEIVEQPKTKTVIHKKLRT